MGWTKKIRTLLTSRKEGSVCVCGSVLGEEDEVCECRECKGRFCASHFAVALGLECADEASHGEGADSLCQTLTDMGVAEEEAGRWARLAMSDPDVRSQEGPQRVQWVMEVMGRSSLPSSTPCLGPKCRGTFALQDLVEGPRAEPSTPSRRRPLRTGVSLRYAMCGLGEKAERALRARGGRAEPPPEPPSISPNKSITEAIMAAPLVLSSDDLVTLAQGGGDEAGNGGGTATPTHTGPPRVHSADTMPGLVSGVPARQDSAVKGDKVHIFVLWQDERSFYMPRDELLALSSHGARGLEEFTQACCAKLGVDHEATPVVALASMPAVDREDDMAILDTDTGLSALPSEHHAIALMLAQDDTPVAGAEAAGGAAIKAGPAAKPEVIGPEEPLDALAREYKHNMQLRKQVYEDLGRRGGLGSWRRVRGDGNSYYRAFMLAYLHHCLSSPQGVTLMGTLDAVVKQLADAQKETDAEVLRGFRTLLDLVESGSRVGGVSGVGEVVKRCNDSTRPLGAAMVSTARALSTHALRERLESEQGESIRSHIMSEGFVTPENEADVDRYIAEVLRVPGESADRMVVEQGLLPRLLRVRCHVWRLNRTEETATLMPTPAEEEGGVVLSLLQLAGHYHYLVPSPLTTLAPTPLPTPVLPTPTPPVSDVLPVPAPASSGGASRPAPRLPVRSGQSGGAAASNGPRKCVSVSDLPELEFVLEQLLGYRRRMHRLNGATVPGPLLEEITSAMQTHGRRLSRVDGDVGAQCLLPPHNTSVEAALDWLHAIEIAITRAKRIS